jgi:Carboxylesterase family
MTGGTRDEAGILVPYPPVGLNLAQWFDALTSLGFTQYPILTDGTTLFDIPLNATTDQIANITFRVGSDAFFNCALNAVAYSAAKHNVFASTYSFMFNRTYSSTNYTRDWCQPGNTTSHPYGDPSLEYYKCHGGEKLYVFGNVRLGLPDRDGHDVTFSQLVVDYWAAFAWSGNPNPDKEKLEKMGYWGTLAEVVRMGKWKEVQEGKSAWMWLQVDGGMKERFGDLEQCKFLGLPLEYMESS